MKNPIDNKAEEIIKTTNRLFNCSERKNAETLWREIAEFMLPNQSNVFSIDETYTKGRKQTQRLYDSTAIQANYELASIMHSILTAPSVKWATLRFDDKKLQDDKNANIWLEDCVERMHSAVNASNFDSEAPQSYVFYTSIGNMVLMCEESDEVEGGEFGGFVFKGWHLSEVVFTENRYGYVDSCYRKFEFTGRQAYEKWGDKVDKEIADKYEKESDCKYKFIHCIYPRKKEEIKRNSLGRYVKGAEPFASVYVDVKNKKVLDESGYIEFPVIVARAEKTSGEVYGRGPGTKALPDTKTLNKYVKIDLQAKSLAALPPTIVEQRAIIGPLAVRPGAQLVVKDIQRIREFVTGTRFDINMQGIEMLRDSIRKTFFLDKLLLPPRKEVGEMTAFEVSERRVDTQRVLGPISGRLESEFLGPIVNRMFNVMFRGGAFKPPPNSVKGQNIKVVYINPLSRSQNAEDLTAINQWLQTGAAMAQMGRQDALDHFDVDSIMKHTARVLNVPADSQASDDVIKSIRENRAKLQAAQAQLEAGVKSADMNAKNAKSQPQGGPADVI